MELTLNKVSIGFLLLVMSPGWVQAQELRLRVGQFDPLTTSLPADAVPTAFREKLAAQAPDRRHAVVQFDSPAAVDPDALERAGARVLDYLPDYAYLVRWKELADTDARAKVESMPGVRYVGAYEPAYRVSPSIWRLTEKTSAPVTMEVVGFKGDRAESLSKLIDKLAPGSQVLMMDDSATLPVAWFQLNGQTPADFASKAAALTQVMWIDRHYPDRLHNRNSVGPIQGNGPSGGPPPDLTPIWDQDIIGTGQVVGVADSGLDRNAVNFSQLDNGSEINTEITDAEQPPYGELGNLFPDRKLVAYYVQPGAIPYDYNVECDDSPSNFHGSHVTGSVAGDAIPLATPTEPNMGLADGMAPNAQILFQDIGNSDSGCLNRQRRYLQYLQLDRAGVGLSNNSYGSAVPDDGDNGYFTSDFDADSASWDAEHLLLIFSAGNEGPELNTAGHPAQAKSPLSVGATQSGDDRTLANFSSRGPAHDGRIKPDITAPGVGIRSVLGNDNNDNPPPDGDGNTFTIRQGTSMASPTVAGGAALMRQYYMDGFYPTGVRVAEDGLLPSAALMKATLLNGTSTYPEMPSNQSGWGRIWLDGNLYFAGDDRQLRVWDLNNGFGITTGQQHEYTVRVEAGQEFRATLVWTDPPGNSFSGVALVNDLDLEVTGAGSTWRGNVFSGAQSTTGGVQDRLNPVEQVRLTAPQSGDYTIRVRAHATPGNGNQGTGRQGYALAVSAAQCDTGASSASELTLDADVSNINLSFSGISGADTTQVFRAEGSCDAPATDYRYLGETAGLSFSDPATRGGVEYAYRVRGADACGEGPLSQCKSIVSEAACKTLPAFDLTQVRVETVGGGQCGVKLSWAEGTPGCPSTTLKYNVYRSTNPFFNPAPGNLLTSVSGTGFDDLDVEPLTTYYYVVKAEDNAGGGDGPNQGNESAETVRYGLTTRGDDSEPGEFTDDPDDAVFVSSESPWQVSNRRASIGSLSYRNAGSLPNYQPLTCAALTTPPLQLQSGSPQLEYDAWYNLEEFWDGIIVEISTDGGQTWQDLPPAGGYPSDLRETSPSGTPINQCGYPPSQGAFNGARTQFQTYSSDLSAFAGQTVQIRWVFTSDPASEFEGFYLDNVRVTSSSTPAACVAGATPRVSGPWFNAAQSGHGWLVEMLDGATADDPSRVNAYWYVYQDGNPVWLIGTGPLEGTSATLDVAMTEGADFPPDFNTGDVSLIPWGTLTFDFNSDTQGTATWDSVLPEFGTGSLDMVQLAPITESDNACRSGSYYNVEQSGHGYVVEVISIGGTDQVILAWYVYQDGQQVWLFGQGELVGNRAEVPLGVFSGADFPPEFDPGAVVNNPWGTATITFTGPDSATVVWDSDTEGYADGSLDVVRLTGIKGKTCQ